MKVRTGQEQQAINRFGRGEKTKKDAKPCSGKGQREHVVSFEKKLVILKIIKKGLWKMFSDNFSDPGFISFVSFQS